MPGSITQASQGGTSPRTSNNIPVTNYHEFEETERKERESQEEKDNMEDATWVQGGREEDDKRYFEFFPQSIKLLGKFILNSSKLFYYIRVGNSYRLCFNCFKSLKLDHLGYQ